VTEPNEARKLLDEVFRNVLDGLDSDKNSDLTVEAIRESLVYTINLAMSPWLFASIWNRYVVPRFGVEPMSKREAFALLRGISWVGWWWGGGAGAQKRQAEKMLDALERLNAASKQRAKRLRDLAYAAAKSEGPRPAA
jgi:hypothetical protein